MLPSTSPRSRYHLIQLKLTLAVASRDQRRVVLDREGDRLNERGRPGTDRNANDGPGDKARTCRRVPVAAEGSWLQRLRLSAPERNCHSRQSHRQDWKNVLPLGPGDGALPHLALQPPPPRHRLSRSLWSVPMRLPSPAPAGDGRQLTGSVVDHDVTRSTACSCLNPWRLQRASSVPLGTSSTPCGVIEASLSRPLAGGVWVRHRPTRKPKNQELTAARIGPGARRDSPDGPAHAPTANRRLQPEAGSVGSVGNSGMETGKVEPFILTPAKGANNGATKTHSLGSRLRIADRVVRAGLRAR